MNAKKPPAEVAKRRALKALDNIEADVGIIRRRLTMVSLVPSQGSDARGMAGEVQALSVQLAIIEALRDAEEEANEQ